MPVDPNLVFAAVRAAQLILRQVELYQKGELSEEEFRELVKDMHDRYDAGSKAWDEA